MLYAEAMEKTVSGFRSIHASGVINENSSDEEWHKVYVDFMNKHGLPL